MNEKYFWLFIILAVIVLLLGVAYLNYIYEKEASYLIIEAK